MRSTECVERARLSNDCPVCGGRRRFVPSVVSLPVSRPVMALLSDCTGRHQYVRLRLTCVPQVDGRSWCEKVAQDVLVSLKDAALLSLSLTSHSLTHSNTFNLHTHMIVPSVCLHRCCRQPFIRSCTSSSTSTSRSGSITLALRMR